MLNLYVFHRFFMYLILFIEILFHISNPKNNELNLL